MNFRIDWRRGALMALLLVAGSVGMVVLLLTTVSIFGIAGVIGLGVICFVVLVIGAALGWEG